MSWPHQPVVYGRRTGNMLSNSMCPRHFFDIIGLTLKALVALLCSACKCLAWSGFADIANNIIFQIIHVYYLQNVSYSSDSFWPSRAIERVDRRHLAYHVRPLHVSLSHSDNSLNMSNFCIVIIFTFVVLKTVLPPNPQGGKWKKELQLSHFISKARNEKKKQVERRDRPG